MKKFTKIFASILCLFAFYNCTDLTEVWYDKTTPDDFFKTKEDIASVLFRPYTHLNWYLAPSGDRWFLQEECSDQFATPTRGLDWSDGGAFTRLHYHTWTPDDNRLWETWRGTLMGIALAYDSRSDLEKLDYTKFGLTEDDKKDNISQLNTLVAFFYLYGLDFFGPLPLYYANEGENLPRSNDVKIYNFVDSLLDESIKNLKIKTPGTPEEGNLNKASAAVLKARLYFNAESYIRENKFAECKAICEDIIAGVYGNYSLDEDWKLSRGFDNTISKEGIWVIPSQINKLQYDQWFVTSMPYNGYNYYGNTMLSSGNNGFCLQPSRKADSTLYTDEDFKLGRPYEKFNDADERKKPYRYLGSKKFEGQFMIGLQVNPNDTTQKVMGARDQQGKVVNLQDRIARIFTDGDLINSNMIKGEENSGVRFVFTPIPTSAEDQYRWGAGNMLIPLTEVYYMLGECEYRLGNKEKAAILFNTVRKRYFEGGMDPNPVTAENLDDYRILDEWGQEFLGKLRRRTDLIRFGLFETGTWWDFTPSNDPSKNRYPVPTQAISGNNNLALDPI